MNVLLRSVAGSNRTDVLFSPPSPSPLHFKGTVPEELGAVTSYKEICIYISWMNVLLKSVASSNLTDVLFHPLPPPPTPPWRFVGRPSHTLLMGLPCLGKGPKGHTNIEY